MIEKNAYFFWGENDKMSWLRYLSFYTFRKFNPTWNIFLYLSKTKNPEKTPWTSTEIQDCFNYNGEQYLDKLKNLNIQIKEWVMKDPPEGITTVVQSDFFRWSTLYNNSGYYFDNDILFVKPLDNFYEEFKNQDIVLCYAQHFSLGCMGSSGNNIEFFDTLYKRAIQRFNSDKYQVAGPENLINLARMIAVYQPNLLDNLKSAFPQYTFGNQNSIYFYPFAWNQIEAIFQEQFPIPNETLGIHWFAGSPISQKYNNLLTEENFLNYKSSFTNCLNNIING